jgi:Protein of unknown function (DUF2851)
MLEEFLHFLWKFKLLSPNLESTAGQVLQIFQTGSANSDSGPDFFDARIRLEDTLWAGNVEIHRNASDWHRHKHDLDKAYDNIILHVVYNADVEIERQNGEKIPCLEIKGKFDPLLYDKYLGIITSKNKIPCEKLIAGVDLLCINNMLETSMTERLKEKSVFINNKLNLNKNNWEQTFYEHLAAAFGFKVNADAFELMAKSLPLKYLGKHKNDILQLEALIFGQAGFLESPLEDIYGKNLAQEYCSLKNKFKLEPIENSMWKFLRLRPCNFPNIRLSQFAALVFKSSNLFSKIRDAVSIEELTTFFQVQASAYWDSHYQFDKKTKARPKKKRLGKSSIHLILINSVIPFLFVYGKQKSEVKYCERALNFLEDIPAENNHIIRYWETIGITAQSAYQSQALIGLMQNYCNNKRCLQCKIGIKLLKV